MISLFKGDAMTAENLLKNIKMREIQTGDEELINDFFDNLDPVSTALFNRRNYNRRGVLRFCAKPDPHRRYWMAELDGKMAGYVFFLDFHTSIPELGLAVRSELQGNGLGRYLVTFAQNVAKESSKGGIQLTTHVANLRGQSLYDSMGFVCMGSCKSGTELFYLYRF